MTTTAVLRPSREDVLTVVRETVSIVCGVPLDSLAADTSLDDIGADSLARVEVAELVEQQLAARLPDLHISDEDLAAFRVPSDVVDYVMARL